MCNLSKHWSSIGKIGKTFNINPPKKEYVKNSSSIGPT